MPKSNIPKKKWTFMVYLAGDNNLDANGAKDLDEMKTVGSNDAINLIAQFDRFGALEETKRFYLRKGTALSKDAVEKLGETNSGCPEALVDFVSWGVKNYPAERYALILWNHGGGWDDTDVYANDRMRAVHRPAQGRIRNTFFRTTYEMAIQQAAADSEFRAILYDDDARDFLDNLEMKKALAQAKKIAGRKMDILGLDACLMSMAEVACQMRSSARYAVGSEQTEPVDGWPYHTLLAELAKKPGMTPKAFASLIVDCYIASYPPWEPVTQSALNLAKSTSVMNAIKNLAMCLSRALENDAEQFAIQQARLQTQSYEVRDNIDLVDFCTLLAEKPATGKTLQAACRKVIEAVCGKSGLVVKSGARGASVKNSYGAAIYFPTYELSPLYAKLDFAQKTGWGTFLDRYLKASRRR